MRKLIYTIATAVIFSLAFTSCEEKNGNENGNGYENGNGIRKLPSRIVLTDTDYSDDTETWIFRYDDQNRLTEVIFETVWDEIHSRIYKTEIEYDANNRVSKITNFFSRSTIGGFDDNFTTVFTFQYLDNHVNVIDEYEHIVARGTFNADGQITKWEFLYYSSDTIEFFYYIDRNLTQIKYDWGAIGFSYSNVLSVFRNVASLDWPLLFPFNSNSFGFFPPSQYMPSKIIAVDGFEESIFTFTYQTDSDGWVTTSTVTFTHSFESHASRTESAIAPARRFSGESNRFGTRAQASAKNNTETWFMTFEYVLAK